MKMGIDPVYIKLAVVLLLLITGCATQPGIKNSEDMNVWADKAIQAGCSNLNQVIDVSTADSTTSNAMIQIMRKTGLDKGSAIENQLTTFFTNPENGSILVLSKINSHALDAVESFIKQWKGASPSSILCVFAQEDRAESLRVLAQEKGFNLHITPLSSVYTNSQSN